MTTEEKLRTAIEALRIIKTMRGTFYASELADTILASITAPRMETVEVKRWICPICEGIQTQKWTGECCGTQLVEAMITYQRPAPEPEVWKGKPLYRVDPKTGEKYSLIDSLPPAWVGKTVIARLKEEE